MKQHNINSLYRNFSTLNQDELNHIVVDGWIRSNRASKRVGFIDLTDGSTLKSLQVVYNNALSNWEELAKLSTGTAIKATGKLKLTPSAAQPFELELQVIIVHNSILEDTPLQKKEHSLEFLRENAHLRAKTKTFQSVFKIRSEASWAIHSFFHKHGFIYLNSPIITANDAEGAGENFIVTTLDNNKYEQDFFSKKASLTVSGQLNAEAYAQAFGKVYTFGPTFRAENSNTTRHAAEFWMIEPEFVFGTIKDNIILAQGLVKYVTKAILEKCQDEVNFLNEKNDEQLVNRLTKIANNNDFSQITYSQAINDLKKAVDEGYTFENSAINWGMDLASEHERYLCEQIYNGPLFIINYPKSLKSFYMKNSDEDNSEGKTVQAMDLLIPGIGELIGGSVREDNYEELIKNKALFNLMSDDLAWYFDLRKYGYAPSAGFGLGLERLIMLLTGMSNIRDVIPFPRTPKSLNF